MEVSIAQLEKAKRGQRFSIEGIDEAEFQRRAEKLKKAAKARGIDVGTVYHGPIKTGIIFVK